MGTIDFVAGCFGGAAGVLVGHPFDTLKVRMQGSSAVYKSTLECFNSIVKKESVKGLYKGVTSPLYSLAAINAIIFGVQGNLLRRMKNPDALSSHFMAGATAGFLQCGICGPMELAKIKLQVQGEGLKYGSVKSIDYTGSIECLRKIYNMAGFRGVSRGMIATILREVPAFGTYFLTYEWICRKMTKDTETECSTGTLLLSGGLAGCAAWIITYPIDVIKTRIQTDGALLQGRLVYKYSGYLDCIRKSISADGYKVFGKGLNATLLRAFPTNAATFAVVAWILRHMAPSNSSNDRKSAIERATSFAQIDG